MKVENTRECFLQQMPEGWCHETESWKIIKALCGDDYPICRVRLVEIDNPEEADAWACRDDTKGGHLEMVRAHERLVDMCFTYGSKIKEEEGLGMKVPIKVEILETMWEPKK